MKTLVTSILVITLICILSHITTQNHGTSNHFTPHIDSSSIRLYHDSILSIGGNRFDCEKGSGHEQTAQSMDYSRIAKAISNFEGFTSHPYRCAGGHLTVGFGTQVKSQKVVFSLDQAYLSKRERIQHDYNELIKYVPRDTALVMCSFAYNCGLGAALRIVKTKSYPSIAKYVYAKGKLCKGLVRRRKEELAMLRSIH